MKSFEEQLRTESAGWVAAGLVNETQRSALLARHPEGEGGGRFIAILGAVGGGLLLAGVCLLIGANWQEIGDWVKIGGMLTLLVGAYAAGWKLKVAPGRYPRIGDAFFVIGAGLFMAGIALVSQVFHLNSRPATGVLAWWLGIVAVPWLVRSKATQAVSLLAMLVWLGMEFGLRGSWLALLPPDAHHEDGMRLVAMLAVVGLSIWLSGLALRGTRHDDFAALHEKAGALLLCGGLYVLGFLRHVWGWREHIGPVQSGPVLLAGALVLAAAWGAWKSSRRDVAAMGAWFVLALVPMAAVLSGWHPGDAGWLWSALAWSGLFVLNVMMVRTGLATGRESWVNIGLGFIALNVITRYFDLFGTMMEGGIFFVISGVIVLTLGIYLERKRRGWLSRMRAGKEARA